MNILVTSAGGPAAIGVIKSLKHFDKNNEHKIIATDVDELSVGFYLADNWYVVPRADEDGFIDEIRDIIKDVNIDLVLPTGNLEIKHFESLKDITNVYMSDSDVINLCNDKWNFYDKIKNDFPTPKTWVVSNDLITDECIAKPRFEVGGSRGFIHCKTMDDIISVHKENDKTERIFQDYLSGTEYTIDVLCDMDNNPIVTVPRIRLETKAGISSKGEIIEDDYIKEQCEELCRFLKLKGPVCIQMKEDDNRKPKFIEVNPRFGGGSYFATLAGVNFVEIIISILEGKQILIDEPNKIKVIRYFEEIVV